MNLVLAAFPPLLWLVPMPVPSQWLCQYEHVCSHTRNQQEELPGLKITRSLDLIRAAPLAGDTIDGSVNIGKTGHSHWGHMAVGKNCWKRRPLVSGADTGKNVCQIISNAKGPVPGHREGLKLIFLFARSMLRTYVHTVTLLSLVKCALAQIKRKEKKKKLHVF